MEDHPSRKEKPVNWPFVYFMLHIAVNLLMDNIGLPCMLVHTNTLSGVWRFPQIKAEKGFLIYQYIFNCDHSYKLKTGISSHLHEKVANGPQHWGTRTAECWLFSSSQEAAAGILELFFWRLPSRVWDTKPNASTASSFWGSKRLGRTIARLFWALVT